MTGRTQPSYSHGASAVPLLGETIGANLRRIAASLPGPGGGGGRAHRARWTYARLDADTDALARGLITAGISGGDRVGIWAPNCAEWVLLQYATAKAGIVLVNINPAYRSHELGYALRQSGVRLLVSAESVQVQQLPGDGGGGRRRARGTRAGDLPGLAGVGCAVPLAAARSQPPDGTDAAPTRWRSGKPACPSTTRSTSSTPAAPPASPRARRCPTTTS